MAVAERGNTVVVEDSSLGDESMTAAAAASTVPSPSKEPSPKAEESTAVVATCSVAKPPPIGSPLGNAVQDTSLLTTPRTTPWSYQEEDDDSPLSKLRKGDVYHLAPCHAADTVAEFIQMLYPSSAAQQEFMSHLSCQLGYMEASPDVAAQYITGDNETPAPTVAAPRVKTPDSINAAAFHRNPHTGSPVDPRTARKRKSRAAHAIVSAIKDKGVDKQQQALAAYTALTQHMGGVGELLGVFKEESPTKKARVSMEIVDSVAEILGRPQCLGRNTNDAISFQETVFFAVVPPAPEDDNDLEAQITHKQQLAAIAHQLGITTRATKARLQHASVVRREFGNPANGRAVLLQIHDRHRHRKITIEMTKGMIDWVLNHCTKVVQSPNKKDSRWVRHEDGTKTLERKYYYTFSVRVIHQEMMKPKAEGGFEGALDIHGNCCISESFLRRHLPPNLRQMTQSQKQMCGCGDCIDAKGIVQAYKAWQTRKLHWLENELQKLAPNTRAYTTYQQSVETYRNFAFPFNANNEREHKYDTARDMMYAMTCAPPPLVNVPGTPVLCKLRCCLGRCNDCPVLATNQFERVMAGGVVDDTDCITWKQYEGRYFCELHGMIGKVTKCTDCELLEEADRPNKKPQRKLHYCQKKAPIGEFMENSFIPFLQRYRYHLFLVIVLGKNYCIKWRLQTYHQKPQNVYILRDYADKLPVVYNEEAQTQGMGNQTQVGMEGLTVRYYKDGQEVMDFYSFLSDLKVQNAKTSYVNTCLLIPQLQDQGLLTPNNDATLFQQSDGCATQYKSSTSLQCIIWLANKYKINVNQNITAPGHGKGAVDSIQGGDKHYCENLMLTANMVKRGDTTHEMENHTIDCDDNLVKGSVRMAKVLSNPNRTQGLVGDKHHSRRKPGDLWIRKRKYTATDWDELHMPVPTTVYQVVDGFDYPRITGADGKRHATTRNGFKDHYHIYCSYLIPGFDMCAVRQIPCACGPCAKQINEPWDHKIADWTKQPRFINPPDYWLRPVLENYNDWKFIRVLPKKDQPLAEEEIQFIHNDLLDDYEQRALNGIKKGGYGAIDAQQGTDAPDGFYVVRWTGEPFTLQEPAAVEGCSDKMPAGTWVCRGRYLDPVKRNRFWYLEVPTQEKLLMRLKYVVHPDIQMEPFVDPTNKPPNMTGLSATHREHASELLKRVPEEAQQLIQLEKEKRNDLDYVELHWKQNDQEESSDEQDEEEEQEQEEEEEEEEEQEEEDDNGYFSD